MTIHRSANLWVRAVITAFVFVLASASMQVRADGPDQSLTALMKKGVVRVADTQASPPWSYLGSDDQPAGYDVAVAREIFRRIGIPKVVLIADSFKNFVPGLNAGKYDVVVNSLARTPERDKAVDFTIPYAVQDFRIWVNDASTSIANVDTLKGKSVGVAAGTANELWARTHLPQSEIKTYDNSGFLYNDLASRRVDAAIDSFTNGWHNKTVNHLPLKAVGDPLVYSLGAAIVPKGSISLQVAMNKAIQSMIDDGTLQRYAHEYFGPDYDMIGDMKKAIQPH